MQITGLYVYPVKGAGGISIDSAQLDAFGVEYDRRWMVVDGVGEFVTQRNCPELALLATTLEPGALVLRSARAGELRLPLEPRDGGQRQVRIWNDVVAADDVGEAAASFISKHLDGEARLLFMPRTTVRQADLDFAHDGDRVSFADGFPMLLISQAALDTLNERLPEPVSMLRFRPNVVVSDAAAHEEDTWRSIQLGAVMCDVVKPCARCSVPTIDPVTARAGKEPLRTLAGYRTWQGKVWFGQNLIHRGRGTLQVGDPVRVLERGDARPMFERTGSGTGT
jgi:uncharacterized protein